MPFVVLSLEGYDLLGLDGGDVDVDSFTSQAGAHLALRAVRIP